MGRLSVRLQRPWVCGAALGGIGALFALIRALWAASGNLSAFAVLGTDYAHPPGLARGLVVVGGSGFDGQFYYRLSLAPWDLATRAFGISMDHPIRFQRLGYPALSWAASLGQQGLAPLALILVNVVALGLLGWACARWAVQLGRAPLWGLLPAGYAGFLVSLSRDLTEIVAALFLVLGLVALRQGRPVLAGLAWSAGVLTRETVLLVVVGLAVAHVVSLVRSRHVPRAEVLAWLLPAVAAVAMQLVVRIATGAIPATTDTSGNLTRPFAALVHEPSLLLHSGARSALIGVIWLGGLVVVVGLGLASLRHTTASAAESISLCLGVALALCLAGAVWNGDPVQLRTFAEIWILATGVILGTARPWRWWVASVAGAAPWGLVALWKISSI